MFTVIQKGFRRWARAGAAAALVLFLSTCGGGGSPSDPNGNGNGSDTGSIQVTASTVNNLDPNGYEVTVDGSVVDTVGVNGSVTIDEVSSGTRTVSLAGVAPNCSLEAPSSQAVSVSKGQTSTVAFEVTCTDPPGGRIVFWRSGSGGESLSVMNSDGSAVMDLIPVVGGMRGSRLTFSPSGDRIAFAATSGGSLNLFVVGIDGGDLTQLTSASDLFEGDPSWSPDGTKIAFVGGPESYEIVVIGADGSGRTQLTEHPDYWSFWPTWSPDGSRIAFSHMTVLYSFFDNRIYVMNSDGSDPGPITERPPVCEDGGNQGLPALHDYYPRWSPDGTQILFLRYVACSDGPTYDYEALFVMSADGSNPEKLVEGAAWADWSPDGSRIVYIKEHIYVMNADGTGQTMVREKDPGGSYRGVGWVTVTDAGADSPGREPV